MGDRGEQIDLVELSLEFFPSIEYQMFKQYQTRKKYGIISSYFAFIFNLFSISLSPFLPISPIIKVNYVLPLSNLQYLMQVDNTNFQQLLPQIIEHIKVSDFVAFDCQFSGLVTKLDKIEGLFPNHIEFYQRIKETAYNFKLFQLGITAFIFDGNNYIPKPYNFYIASATHTPSYNNVMVCEVQSMEFLANNHLNFHRVFTKGIKSSRLYAKEDKEQKHKNHPGPPINYKNMFFLPDDELLIKQIESLVELMKENPKIQKIINFKTKNILIYFKSKYQNLLTDKPKKNMGPFEYNVRMLKKLIEETQPQKQQEQPILLPQSLQVVIEAIIKGGKPIVGHFPNLDIGLIVHSFLTDIPDTYENFCYLINQCFSYILDTKVLSRRIQSRLKGLKVDLASLFRACFNPKLLENYSNLNLEDCKEYLSKQQHHEAGYDSFITGCAFIGMANYMAGEKQRINFKILENENKLLYSRFSGEVSINGNMLCPTAIEYEEKIVIQSKKKEENPEWQNHAALLSKFGNLIVYEDHDELYYVYENVQNIGQIIELMGELKLKRHSERKIIRARNMYKVESQQIQLMIDK